MAQSKAMKQECSRCALEVVGKPLCVEWRLCVEDNERQEGKGGRGS